MRKHRLIFFGISALLLFAYIVMAFCSGTYHGISTGFSEPAPVGGFDTERMRAALKGFTETAQAKGFEVETLSSGDYGVSIKATMKTWWGTRTLDASGEIRPLLEIGSKDPFIVIKDGAEEKLSTSWFWPVLEMSDGSLGLARDLAKDLAQMYKSSIAEGLPPPVFLPEPAAAASRSLASTQPAKTQNSVVDGSKNRQPAWPREATGDKSIHRVLVALEPTSKKSRFGEFSDFIVDSYPTGEWLFDTEATDDAKRLFVFYAHDPEAVRKVFSATCGDFSLKISRFETQPMSASEMEKVRERLDD